MKNKNQKTLNSFVEYCQQHPELRFWQALRNWSGFSFVWVSFSYQESTDLLDTYFFTEKNK